jgi:RNA polymerase sigma-70 factor (ECF subfamily)
MDPTANGAAARQPASAEAFERLLAALRPKLHRYCARMVGSTVEAEDVVQEALVKAIEAVRRTPPIANEEAWLFRIAHNAALDHLRQRARRRRLSSDEDVAMIADPVHEVHQRQAAAAGLRTFMRLPASERSSVILMDVLGYSLEEIGGITESSISAVKAALHRGRKRLRAAAQEPDEAPPILSEADRARLSAYVERFNARDFDAIRDMLSDDVRLDLVSRTRLTGRTEVGRYFGNYDKAHDWRLQAGFVDRHPAIIAHDPSDPSGKPVYFIVLQWAGGRVSSIRDFRHARYAIEAAEIVVVDQETPSGKRAT